LIALRIAPITERVKRVRRAVVFALVTLVLKALTVDTRLLVLEIAWATEHARLALAVVTLAILEKTVLSSLLAVIVALVTVIAFMVTVCVTLDTLVLIVARLCSVWETAVVMDLACRAIVLATLASMAPTVLLKPRATIAKANTVPMAAVETVIVLIMLSVLASRAMRGMTVDVLLIVKFLLKMLPMQLPLTVKSMPTLRAW